MISSASLAVAQDVIAPASDSLALYQAQQQAFRAARDLVAPSVVTIETVGGTQPPARPTGSAPAGGRRDPRRPFNLDPTGSGFIIADGPTTGMIYSEDGHILTSLFNFIRDPAVITVTLPDGRRFVGEFLARDEVRRLAMIKIEAAGLPVPVWINGVEDLRVGQWAVALGRGFGGSDCTLSAGIISGLNRQSGLAVQTDAHLSPANFGGPLIDLDGRVIGLNVPMGMGASQMAGVELYDSGIGFAVPPWQLLTSAKDLAVGHNLRRGLLGVRLDTRQGKGLRVVATADPSPARRSGIEAGDLIAAVDGLKVESYPELTRIMRSRLAGQRVTISIQRDDREIEIPVVLAVPEDLGELAPDEVDPLLEPPPATEPAEEDGDEQPETP